jgi:hypothetical protein
MIAGIAVIADIAVIGGTSVYAFLLRCQADISPSAFAQEHAEVKSDNR